jgi:phosphoglycolate phosphatase-like HAD superfamily hydrolase
MAVLLLFDIDGTILNSGGSGRQSLKESINAITGVNCEKAVDFSFMGRTDRYIIHTILKNLDISISNQLMNDIKEEYLNRLRVNISKNSRKFHILGISPFLESLQGHDKYSMGLQTGNFRDGAFIKLQSLGLDSFFQVGGFGDSFTDRTEVIRQAIHESSDFYGMDFSPSNTIVIGDTPADIYSGKALDTRTIAVCSDAQMYEKLVVSRPDLLIRNFENMELLYSFINNGTKYSS